MQDATQIATRYLAAWNETDAATRRRQLAAIWTDNAIFVDPMSKVQGHAAIDEMIAAVQQRFPTHRFSLHGTPQSHNDRIRFSWALADGNATPAAIGTDVGVLAADGRLSDVTGFFDQLIA